MPSRDQARPEQKNNCRPCACHGGFTDARYRLPLGPRTVVQNDCSLYFEEAYEVADAIERGDLVDLKEELGDLLLQVVYHARMAEEAGEFDFDDVADGITRKMIRRHPHVFGTSEERALGPQKGSWERIKTAEKAEKAAEKASLQDALLNKVAAYSVIYPLGFQRCHVRLSCRTKRRRWASIGRRSVRFSIRCAKNSQNLKTLRWELIHVGHKKTP